jgi:hypothetical protein
LRETCRHHQRVSQARNQHEAGCKQSSRLGKMWHYNVAWRLGAVV